MKLKISRDQLLTAVQMVIGAVERRQTLAVLGNVLVQAQDGEILLTGTDLEVELKARAVADVAEPGEITVPARKLFDICRNLPVDADMDLTLEQDRLMLKSGRSRFTLSTLPAVEFPVLEELNANAEFEMKQSDLKRAIEKTAFSMAQQDVRYYLNGLLFELSGNRLRCVATDGHRLSLCDADVSRSSAEEIQVIVPRKGVQELLRLLGDGEDRVRVEISANHIRTELPEVRFTSKLIDGRFPDYNRVIPKDSSATLIANREELRASLARTAILSNEKYKGVRLALSEGLLEIQTHNPDQEEAEESLGVVYSGSPVEVGFNVNYLMDVMQVVGHEEVRIGIKDAQSSCLVEDPQDSNCRFVIMPMRL